MKKMLGILVLLMMPLALQADLFKDKNLPGGLEITYSFRYDNSGVEEGDFPEQKIYRGTMLIHDNVGFSKSVPCKMTVFYTVESYVEDDTGIGKEVVVKHEQHNFKADGIDYAIVHTFGTFGSSTYLKAESKAIGRSIRKEIEKIG